ncbi:MGT family glycosyltransferase [Paenibacillus forsythiae]|uniref:MGT family glycosyltransferase n=1 Tax=Paenibacillus forsythiae TaxID=365616 RepID=A0ABU3HBH2_9BACL|nr:macrolide family glycosyltransferase [Paenibacillus forsythiae]MDT3427382.1 MGT family glycosyltransferase [Paenibacillus forsythiae]
MKRIHIAMINVPAYGHVNPTLAVVSELVKRGYKVTYPTTEQFLPAISETGATPLLYQLNDTQFDGEQMMEDVKMRNPNLPLTILEQAISFFAQLEQLYKDELPDFILFDFMGLAGKLFAAKHGIEAVRLFSSYALNEHFSFASDFPDETRKAMASVLEACSEKEGIPGLTVEELFRAEKLNIAFLPRAFQPESDTFDERYLFTGPSLGTRSYQESLPLSEIHDRPVLLISLGTVFNPWPEFYKMCIEAFRDSKWQVIMSTGTKIDPETLGEIPGNFIVRQQLPQLEILPHAKLFITHGGMNSTMEALSHGVPMVVIPQMFEQEITARRVTLLGLGQHYLPDEVTVQVLQQSVQEVSEDEQLRKRVYDMQKQIQEAGGAIKAAEGIEQFINETSRQNAHAAH